MHSYNSTALPHNQFIHHGLVDLTIINSYIVFNPAARAASGLSKCSHVTFLKQLHIELCQLRDDDWEALITNESVQATPSKVPNPIVNKSSKVCSPLKDSSKSRGGDSSTYCSTCKLQNASKKPLVWRVFLCEKKRHTFKGELRSCFDIWHKCWANGTLAPGPTRGGRRTIRARAPAQREANVNGEEGDGGRQ
ncbi:hypothetical protein PHMEG_00028878 [Phytophthora megakarya]|uniref:Uncharacterized protein n=1 Tax=Phytophthora megakarya TaxID=4795 RepID=A0A225V3Y2_9STRA|nr:hypothetical protein PHMEG_00028878 [Phytophthora megakarya]